MKLMTEIKWHYDEYDRFGFTQEWRFALAEYLLKEYGHSVPGYYSPGFSHPEDAYTLDTIQDIDPSQSEALYAYEILTRYREWLRHSELDY